MKKLLLAFLLISAMAMVHGTAFAYESLTLADDSYWYIVANGEIDVTGQDQITFDLHYYNADAYFSAINWDIDVYVDTTELTPHYNPDAPTPPDFLTQYYWVDYSYEDTVGNSFGSLFMENGMLVDDQFSIAGGSLGAAIWIAPGDNLMASITFDILDPDILNGIVEADVYVMASDLSLDEGFYQDDGNLVYVNTNSTLNPDVVSAVPVPAAVWLLGSGLLGLVGLRRRNG